MPKAIFPFGNSTIHFKPARAAYAAAEADVLPVLAQTTTSAPLSFALETAIVIPRSLNEAVGLSPSYLRYNSMSLPISRASRSAFIRGVFPSNKVTIGVASLTGK